MTIKFDYQDSYLVGVISDTHGHVPSGIYKAFHHVDLIIHAGDIGDEKVLEKLSQIAPIVAVRGNMDFGKWANHLPKTEIIEIGEIVLYVLHIGHLQDLDPIKNGFKIIISGHTHHPELYEKDGITFLNPGSATYPKFGHPASASLIQIKGDTLRVKLIHLKD